MTRDEYVKRLVKLQAEISMAADDLEAEIAELKDDKHKVPDTDTLFSARTRLDWARVELTTINAAARGLGQ